MSSSQGRAPDRRVSLVPRGRRAQRGQALIEFTFVFTFVMMPLVVGVTDIAALLNDNVRVVYAAREGARTGAVLGMAPDATSPDPDCAIVGAIYTSLLNQNDVTVTSITIFQIQHDGTVTGNEDVYPGGDICDSSGTTFQTAANPDTWPGVPTAGAAVRDTTPFSEDTLGVRIDFSYAWRFNVLGFAPFSGYDVVQFAMNPAGEPTLLPGATPTPPPGATPTPPPGATPTPPPCTRILGSTGPSQPQAAIQALPTPTIMVTPCA